MYLRLSPLSLAALLPCIAALSPAGWREQSIYQVVTDRFALTGGGDEPPCSGATQLSLFCNGSYQGIIDKLDYIQGMGFTAMWISPVVQNIEGGTPDGYTPDGSAYHGYWINDIYKINEHFGGAQQLKNLSNALHDRGMYLMVDTVVNDMVYYCGPSEDGECGPGNTIDYSSFSPFNSSDYFHPYCKIDYNNKTSILDCWEGDETVPLADLRTEDENVQSLFNAWITDFVQEYGVDGLRIDSLQQAGSFFFPNFWKAAGELYMVGEVFQKYPTVTCPYQQEGMPGVLNYPMFYYITDAFSASTGSMEGLANGISYMHGNCSDTTLLGSFLENQDNPRFTTSTEDIALAMNAITFTLLQDGIPILYYGQEQHVNGSNVPFNRGALWTQASYDTESVLYQMVAKVNAARARVIEAGSNFTTYKIQTPYYDDHTIVTRKGVSGSQIVAVYSNVGSDSATYNVQLSGEVTGFEAGMTVTNILTCDKTTTGSQASLEVTIEGGNPIVLVPSSVLDGSSICTS